MVQQSLMSAGEPERHLRDRSECAVDAGHQVAGGARPRPKLRAEKVKNEDQTQQHLGPDPISHPITQNYLFFLFMFHIYFRVFLFLCQSVSK